MKIFIAQVHQPIIDFLISQNPYFPWAKEFEQGKIRVGKYFIGKNYMVSPGDRVIHDPCLEIPEPKVNLNYTLIYEDEYLAVINKPVPLPVHPTGTYFNHSLTSQLKREGKNWYSIHRLDSETSGVLLLAKKPSFVELLSQALQAGEKIYMVMVYGTPPRRFTVKMPLGKKPGSVVFKRQGMNPCGKDSQTDFYTVKKFKKGDGELFSLLLAKPLTGRTHQIRAHLAEKGYPVVGDKIYGKDENFFIQSIEQRWSNELLEKLELERQFLHCRKIILKHPFMGKIMMWKAPLPQELLDYLNNLLKPKK